ncbi:MAG TPA: OmpA family protein [Terriglobales bacterium]|jgi:OOP family OmpA-OmpF porin|nr:OmpA family protein [Terriglobales bacterium]
MHRKIILMGLLAEFLLSAAAAFGTTVKGMINSRSGDTLSVKGAGGTATVVLTDNTKTKDDRGLFGLDKEHLSDVVLVPGLKVSVDGTSDNQGRVVADVITVDGDDLETAEMIQAGLNPTAQQVATNVHAIEVNKQGVAANQQELVVHKQKIEQNMEDIKENTERFTALNDYDVKDQATVKFNAGSLEISPEDQEALKKLAQNAAGLSGYIVDVTGYADSTGSAAMNTKLSEERAKAVVSFLFQQGKVPMRRIVAPGAMGEYGPVASNETKSGRAENRRVDVKVLVNKGIAGQ